MIVINLCGGLGNQMFQYALGIQFMESGNTVRFNTSSYRNDRLRKYELNAFGINEKDIVCDADFVKTTEKDSYLGRLKCGILKKPLYFREKDVRYDEKVLGLKNAYLDGYWQNQNYFIKAEAKVREVFSFAGINDINIQEIAERIKSTLSVSVHVRLTDYKELGIGVPDDYYKRAIEIIKEKYPEAVFYVFSDEINEAEKILKLENSVTVRCTKEKPNYYDMYLMSLCKHNIIANSSFSWWGAWLNSNKEKTVIAPSLWYKDDSSTEIICNNWIKC